MTSLKYCPIDYLGSAQFEQIPIVFGVWPFWLTFFLQSRIFWWLYGCISSAEITLFLVADILLQHVALFQC